MIRGVLASVVLSGILIFAVYRVADLYDQGAEQRLTRIDIWTDRITYRTSQYATPSLLAIGLKAAGDPPRVLALHDCRRMDEFVVVVDIVREQGYSRFDIELPEDC